MNHRARHAADLRQMARAEKVRAEQGAMRREQQALVMHYVALSLGRLPWHRGRPVR